MWVGAGMGSVMDMVAGTELVFAVLGSSAGYVSPMRLCSVSEEAGVLCPEH